MVSVMSFVILTLVKSGCCFFFLFFLRSYLSFVIWFIGPYNQRIILNELIRVDLTHFFN
jgi:hypothetical protein